MEDEAVKVVVVRVDEEISFLVVVVLEVMVL